MNDQECREAYDRLLEMLNSINLGWVTTQVEEQIRLGRTVAKEIETLKENPRRLDMFPPDQNSVSFAKGPKATFPITVDYQPPERLRLLVDAIEQVVINTADMEKHLIDFFGHERDNWSGISFQSEDSNSLSIVIDTKSASLRLEAANRLRSLIRDLGYAPRFQAVCAARGWFRQNGVVSSCPPADNARRWAVIIL